MCGHCYELIDFKKAHGNDPRQGNSLKEAASFLEGSQLNKGKGRGEGREEGKVRKPRGKRDRREGKKG